LNFAKVYPATASLKATEALTGAVRVELIKDAGKPAAMTPAPAVLTKLRLVHFMGRLFVIYY
jgi:hypothetical protein